MLNVTIVFKNDWIDQKRKEGVRVVRTVEKWITNDQNLKVKLCTSNIILVELADDYLDNFKAGLGKMVSENFSVSSPSIVFSCEVKQVHEQKNSPEKTRETETQTSGEEAASTDNSSTAPKTTREISLLPELLDRVPFKFSKSFSDYLRETATVVPMLIKMSSLQSFWSQCLLVSIDDGYGMTNFLNSLCQLYAEFGIANVADGKRPTPYEMRIDVDAQGFNIYSGWDKAVETADRMNRNNKKVPGSWPILSLDISAWQNKLHTDEIKKYLRQLNVFGSNFTIVFKIPFVEARAIKVVSEALGDIFSIRPIVVPPTSMEDLVAYATDQLAKRGFSLAEDAKSNVEKMIIQEKRDASFFGYKTMDKLVEKIIFEKAKNNCSSNKEDNDIARSDIATCVLEDDSFEIDPKEELNELIGLDAVKKTIYEIITKIKAHKSMPKNRKRSVKRPAIHMMFTGNPGTGKTTVARIVAELFHKEGILSKGHLIEVKGRDLCAEYIGQTAPKTSGYCRDAYGSVLFVDEAYALFTGVNDSKKDFGYEALTTLVAEMENHRYDLCVILAGYTDEMKTMINGNPGMESRIPYTIEFPNYSREELFRIFFMMVNEGGFKYEKELESAVRDFFKKISDAILSSKDFSNARFVRNLYERTWGKAACRSSLAGEEITLLASDLLGAAEETEFKQLIENKPSKSIGFGS